MTTIVKKLKALLFLIFFLFTPSVFASEATQVLLNIEDLNQKRDYSSCDYLCWAYASMSILHWYGVYIDIDPILIQAFGSKACGSNPLWGTSSSVDKILSAKGQISSNPSGPVSLDVIKNSINGGRPLPIGWDYLPGSGKTGGHCVVICGYYKQDDQSNYVGNDMVKYMNPWTGIKIAASYDYLMNTGNSNTLYKWKDALELLTTPSGFFSTTNSSWDALKYYYNLLGIPLKLGSYLGDQNICEPFAAGTGCTTPAECGVNVHKVPSLIWFGRAGGSDCGQCFKYPVAFPKKGVYTITLTCRGSVCAWKSSSSLCDKFQSSYHYTISEVGNIASVGLYSSQNYLSGKSTITGVDLDNPAWNGWSSGLAGGTCGDKWVTCTPIPFSCRAFTYRLIDVSNGYDAYSKSSDYGHMMEPGDKDVSFTAYITQPSVENITITMLSGLPGIVGLSIHKIQTSFVRPFTYGCKESCVNNPNPGVDFDDPKQCVYTPIPAAPSNLTATASSTSQITLNWQDNSNNESGFTIAWAVSGGSFNTLTSVGENVTSFPVQNLAQNSSCQFKILASNCAGNSAYSNIASATTPHNPQTPTNLVANSNFNGILLTWTDNADNETGYTVSWATTSGTNPSSKTIGQNQTSTLVSGLSPGFSYNFKVQAFNSISSSPLVGPVTARAPGAPYPNQTLSFTGSIPNVPPGVCIFMGYQIYWGDVTDPFVSTSVASNLAGKIFTHHYSKPGVYFPYVSVHFTGICGNINVYPNPGVVKPNIMPLLNLLLGD
jgi:hypothetical protein